MSSKKISDLPDGGALQGADEIPAVRAGANVRVSGSALVGSNDARLTDARTPKPHAASHLGGADDVLATLDGRYAPKGLGSRTFLADLRDANEAPVRNITADVSRLAATWGTNLTIPTGMAGNDVVEPSVLFDSSAPFLGYTYLLCIAPYFTSSDLYENPCLWVSNDGATWFQVVYTAGVGAVNTGAAVTATPIITSGAQGDGRNSDPYIVVGPDGTHYLIWNQFLNATGVGGTGTGGNNWSVKVSTAPSIAGPWSAPVTALASSTATIRPASPSAFWDGTKWHIYAVDLANTSVTSILHYTAASLTGAWTKQTNPSISLPTGYTGQVWWHLNAYRWGAMHLLLVQDTAAGTSGGGNLWMLASRDNGATWAVPPKPMFPSNSLYRSALVFTERGSGLGIDLFYGRQAANWTVSRSYAGFGAQEAFGDFRYGAVTPGGVPSNALAVSVAKIPVAPYLFGDTVNRADSAVAPGTADSGTAYTVSAGTAGVSSKQLYSAVAANTRAVAVVAGLGDNVTMGEFSVVDTATQGWLVLRYTDASNYVRAGYQGTSYKLQNIVAGAVAQDSGAISPGPTPTNGDVIAVVCSGSTVTMFVNGVQVFQALGWTSNQGGSGIGFQASAIVARFRNLSARPLVGGA